MKRIIFIISLLFLFSVSPSLAISPTASPSANPTVDEVSIIRELKEKVAQKVTELRKNKKIVYYGEIKEIKEESFVLITNNGEKTIDTLQKTNYYWINTQGKKLKLSFSNLEKGDFVVIDGETEEGDKITAKTIVGKAQLFILMGNINKVIRDGQSLTVSFKAKDVPMTIIVTDNTDILNLNDDNSLKKGNFKDLESEEKIIILGSYNDNTKEKIQAKKIIIYQRPTLTPTLKSIPTKVKSSN